MIPLALALWPVIGPVMAWAQAVPPEATNDARPTAVTKRHNEIVRVGQDVVVKEGESVREVVVVGGGLILDGEVRHDVVVVAGPATINSRVGGNLVVVMGKVTLGPKAEINGETTVVGGELNADPQAKMRRSQNVLSPETIPALRYVVDWVTQGLMVARPLPPRVPWVRFLSKGELLSDKCFGGNETLAADEGRIYVPMSMIRGDHSKLLPGKIVFFDAIHRASHGENPKVEEIGPFRLSGSELKEMPNSKEDRQVAVDYRLGPKGQIPAHAELLRAAVYSDGKIALALIEKSFKQDGRDQVAVSTTSRH